MLLRLSLSGHGSRAVKYTVQKGEGPDDLCPSPFLSLPDMMENYSPSASYCGKLILYTVLPLYTVGAADIGYYLWRIGCVASPLNAFTVGR